MEVFGDGLLRVPKFVNVLIGRLLLGVMVALLMVLLLVITAFRSVIRNFGHALRVIGEGVGTAMGQSHRVLVRANRLVLRQALIDLAQVLKVVVLERLTCGHSDAVIVDEKLGYDFLGVGGDVRDQLGDACTFLRCKIELHMTRHSTNKQNVKIESMMDLPLEFGQELWRGRPQNIVNFVHLVKFVIAWEQRKQGQYFKVDTAHTPIVHLMIVVAISQEAFRRSVPSRADILCKRWLRIDSPT